MAFQKSRILNTQQFVRQILESNRNGERFCFILGSGASVESGIPSGNALEMRWMDCLMGKADDLNYPAMDPEDTRQCGEALYEDGLLEHKFDEIEAAWKEARKKGTSIPSEYYFDIFKLRFYPNQRNGYRYLERIMDSCKPSLGYHTLALMLADSSMNNLVITTNFDSLIEDALFIYTDKKPLVVSHESLAGFIESDTQRPIIAKVHRGLMYAPFNTPDATSKLKKEWRKALLYAFNTYTPVVIGYGGGDRSLMAFLEEETTIMPHGMYWCYHEPSGFPDEKVCQFISEKNGYIVRTGGFDALMLKLGAMQYKDEISYSGTKSYLKAQCDQRIQEYHSQLAELSKKPSIAKELRTVNAPAAEKKPKASAKQTTAPAPRQPEATESEQPVTAETKPVAAEAPVVSQQPTVSQSAAPQPAAQMPMAPQSVQPAAPVMPQPTVQYQQPATPVVPQSAAQEIPQSVAQMPMQPAAPVAPQPAAYAPQPMAAQYHQPMTPVAPQTYEPQPAATEYRQPVPQPMMPEAPQPTAADLRQAIFAEFRQPPAPEIRQPAALEIKQPVALEIRQPAAMELRQPAVRTRQPAAPKTNPSDSRAQLGAAYYIRQGNRACETRDFDRAIASYQQATRLDPSYALAYYNCGVVYNILHQYEEAIASCSKAIALDSSHVSAYTTRGIAYKNLGQMEEAIGDYTSAVELNPTDASAYNNRGNAYFALGQHEMAVEDYTRAIEYNPSFKRAYLNRAIAYRALGNTAMAEADKITADAL